MLIKMRQWILDRRSKKIIEAFADNRRDAWANYSIEEISNAAEYLNNNRHTVNTVDEIIYMSMMAHLLHRGYFENTLLENIQTYQLGVILRWWCQCEKQNGQYEKVYQYLSDKLTHTTIPLLGPLWHGAPLDVNDWSKILDYWPHYHSYLYPDTSVLYSCLVTPQHKKWPLQYLFDATTPITQVESYALAVTHFLLKNYPDNWRSRIDADDFLVEVYEELSHISQMRHQTPLLVALTDFWCNPSSSWRNLADVMPSIDIFIAPSITYEETPLY